MLCCFRLKTLSVVHVHYIASNVALSAAGLLFDDLLLAFVNWK